ncbi:pentatricopeptide repeat-containing protein At3g49740 [Rhodamnia argentea]|uniref:Pentatricopeptide repeat-containing protein At3g49740 n=1 Tax=Rhodamnia argentea TaxID=178133 RepID=A0ABM3HK75_9MYRT|nr:pentatricopeptide repeat-containing protein At3g49740 [Rhodamnia argentea]
MKVPLFSASTVESTAKQLYRLNTSLVKLTRSNLYTECLQLFVRIRGTPRLKPDHYTLSNAITACANARNATLGEQLHAHAIRAGFKAYPHVANTLLSLYAKAEDMGSVKRVFGEIENPDVYSWTTVMSACAKLGEVDYACEAFDEMPHRDVAVWNAIITGCADNGHEEIAFAKFREMHELGIRHDNYSFACVLSLCSLELLEFGRQVHCLVTKTGFLIKASVINSLLTMYFDSERVGDGYKIFDDAEVRDEITFNAMIDGLVGISRDYEALLMFREMQRSGLRPTQLTFVSLMSSCSLERDAAQLHVQAIKRGLESCTAVINAAITMYSGCCNIEAAKTVFNRLDKKDLVSWNAIISSYAQLNFSRSAILTYLQMQRLGFEPDEFTFGSLLTSSESTEIVEMIHALLHQKGLLLNIQASNALTSAYSKHGKMMHAFQVFQDISLKNLISWNTLFSGLLSNGFPLQGLQFFSEMFIYDLMPNAYTLSIALAICGTLCSLGHARQIHCYIIRNAFLSEASLSNGLITVYSKCGVLDSCLRVFNKMPARDIVSWNALISAFAQHGKGKEAVNCFEAMRNESKCKPDVATFTALLSACSHCGLVSDGTRIFDFMVNTYGLTPQEDHFSCMLDLLGRAGYLDEAETVINSQHFQAHSSLWWTLFSACASHNNLRFGRVVAKLILKNEPDNPSVYVLLSNIYASAGQWDEAANVRKMLKSNGVTKQRGCSWIRC